MELDQRAVDLLREKLFVSENFNKVVITFCILLFLALVGTAKVMGDFARDNEKIRKELQVLKSNSIKYTCER